MNRLARWLFQAEGIEVEVDAAEWNILSRMGVGVKAGARKCGAERISRLLSCVVV